MAVAARLASSALPGGRVPVFSGSAMPGLMPSPGAGSGEVELSGESWPTAVNTTTKNKTNNKTQT